MNTPSNGSGLQAHIAPDDKVSVPVWAEMSGSRRGVAGEMAQAPDDICCGDQSRSCAYADRDAGAATSGNVTDEVWKKYIENQNPRYLTTTSKSSTRWRAGPLGRPNPALSRQRKPPP